MFAFTKIFLLATLAISASAATVGGHAARSPSHHHAVAARRAAAPVAAVKPAMEEQPLGRRVSRKARRQSVKRCRPRTSTVVPTPTPAPVSSTIIASPTSVVATSSVEATTTSSSSPAEVPTTSTTPAETVTSSIATSEPTVSSTPKPEPTTSSTPTPETTSRAEPTTSSTPTPEPTPTSTPPAEPTTTSTPPPAPTTSSTPAPAPTQGPGPTTGGNHEGDATYFDTGLGACGVNNNPDDNIVAVPQDMFDNYPNYNRVNPNSNPICNKKIRAFFEGDYLDVIVTDRCTGCVGYDLDFTTGAFAKLFKGKVNGRGKFHWSWHSEIGL